MKLIISPAKKMNVDNDVMQAEESPHFLADAEQIKNALQALSRVELKALYKASDSIVEQNYERLRTMDLSRNLTPALFAYEGIQYQYMAPQIFERTELDYVREHLRILSGLYGVLRPFDGVVPYRLEMQAKLAVSGYKNLYDYWGSRIAEHLWAETDCIVNLASAEYSQVVTKYLATDAKPNSSKTADSEFGSSRFADAKSADFKFGGYDPGDSTFAGNPAKRLITCTFGELVHQKGTEKIVEKGTMCKMARGQMVRFMAVNRVTNPEDIKNFNSDYVFSEKHSDPTTFVFLKR